MDRLKTLKKRKTFFAAELLIRSARIASQLPRDALLSLHTSSLASAHIAMLRLAGPGCAQLPTLGLKPALHGNMTKTALLTVMQR